MAGWPGTRASLWQQAGRAGRAGTRSLAVYVAADDPLDTYVVGHPEVVFGQPVEAAVLDPVNPYVLGPHLAAAAAELPLREADLDLFGGDAVARPLLDALVARGILRRRPNGGWYWARSDRPGDHLSLRELKVGERVGDRIEVTSGVKPGELVAMTDVEKLVDGERVSVARSTMTP